MDRKFRTTASFGCIHVVVTQVLQNLKQANSVGALIGYNRSHAPLQSLVDIYKP